MQKPQIDTPQKKILVIYAHPAPRRSRVNRELNARIESLPYVKVHELYEMYPDYILNIEREKAALLEADVVILQHPFYWYSCPPLMKAWMDSVLEVGFAYGPGGDKLKGKHWMQVISVGGPESAYGRDSYNHFTLPELLRPFEQTAYLCQMIYHEPMINFNATEMHRDEIQQAADRYVQMLESFASGDCPVEGCTL